MTTSLKRKRTVDPAAQKVLDRTDAGGIETAYDRHDEQEPRCGFGELGICCRICEMGPCRISPFATGPKRGICGATAATIAARHLIRQVAAGAAAHSDHGHDIVNTLLHTAKGTAQGYVIKSPERLYELAKEWGVSTEKKSVEEIAREMADLALKEFNRQEGEIAIPPCGRRRPPWIDGAGSVSFRLASSTKSWKRFIAPTKASMRITKTSFCTV